MPKPRKYWDNKWKKIRVKILERDNYTCQYCKVTMKELAERYGRTDRLLLVHHIMGDSDEAENLATLCYTCHYLAGLLASDASDAMLKRMNYTWNRQQHCFEKIAAIHIFQSKKSNAG